MKLLKKTFALMLSLILVVGMIPGSLMTAHAAGTEITEAELFEQIEFTSAMIDGSSIVNSNSSAFTKTNGTGWELKYSQSGKWLYFDLYLDNADIDGVSLVGKLQKDSAISVSFNVHVKGECSIGGLWLTIQHEDPKYGWGGSDAKYSRLETNIIYESDNATLSAENSIQTNGLYYVELKVNSNGYSGATLKCSYVVTTALSSVSSITMTAVNFVAKRTSGTGAVFDVGDCTITFKGCNTLFNLPEGMVPFEDGHNNVIYDTAMVEYGGKLEKIHAQDPAWSSMYVDSNRYAAIKKSLDLTYYLNFINQDPAMPSGKTETDITATLDNTETYQFNNAALPSWLADGGFNIYRNGNLYKGSNIMPIESVANGNSDAIKVNHTFDEAGTYKLVEALTLKYFNTPVNDFVDAHYGYKKNTFNITTTEGSGEGGGETTEIAELNANVEAPAVDATPSTSVTTTGEGYTVTLSEWLKVEDGSYGTNTDVTFEGGSKYGVIVKFAPKDGYQFADSMTVTINDKTATKLSDNADGSVSYRVFFDALPNAAAPTVITGLNANVEAPAVDTTPSTSVTTTGEGYTATLSEWLKVEDGSYGTNTDVTFEGGSKYGVIVKFAPKDGYQFADSMTVTINDKTATKLSDNADGSVSYRVFFDALPNAAAPTEYNITVTGGTASANKAVAGTSITLTAEQIDGKVFSHWEVNGATVSDANAKETTFTMGNADVTAEAIYDDCECNCHKGGIKGFFFKFVLFFQKIFGMNTVCGCQMKHNVFCDLW